jgi:uncharacterized protein
VPPNAPDPVPVRFPSGDGACVGDLYLPAAPDGSGSPFPVVVMAHGLAAERAFGLSAFARVFQVAGMAVLAFDYRHLGESPGEPRGLVSPTRQLADYRAALAFVAGRPELDPERIGLWGTSFSGGHVLALAAERPRGLRAVVSQIPFVSGLASTFAYPLRYHAPALALGALDTLGGLVGAPPLTVPVTREGGFAVLATPGSHAGYRAMVPPESDWSGRVPARVFLRILAYHPGRRSGRIGVPTLVVAAREDGICPVRAVRRVAARIPGARLEEFSGGHFDAYFGARFEAVSALEAGFLAEHLLPASAAAG